MFFDVANTATGRTKESSLQGAANAVIKKFTPHCVNAGSQAMHTGLVGAEGPLYSLHEYTWERLLVLP